MFVRTLTVTHITIGCLIAFCCGIAPVIGHAQSAAPPYAVDQWTVTDGLPQNSVLDIEQTADHYLWIATRGGLARFDGNAFTVFTPRTTPELPAVRINVLHEDADSTLWIGTTAGLVRYEAGTFTSKTHVHPDLAAPIRSLTSTADGGVWVATEDALLRYQDGTVDSFTSGPFADLEQQRIQELEAGSDDTLWIRYSDAVVQIRSDTMQRFTVDDGLPSETLITFGRDHEDRLWVGDAAGYRARFEDGSFVLVPPIAEVRGRVRAYVFGTDAARVWMAGEGRLYVREGNEQMYEIERAGASHTARLLYKDRSGTLWMGTEGGGLFRIRQPLFAMYGVESGLSHEVALSITQTPDSSLWIGTNCGGLNRLSPEGRLAPYVTDAVPENACLYATLSDTYGNLWLGMDDLIRIPYPAYTEDADSIPDRAERIALLEEEKQRVRGDFVHALYQDPHAPEVLWVGTINGLYRVEEGAVTRHYTPDDGLLTNRVQYIQRTTDGALWLSTRFGLSRLQDGTFTNFTPENGFPSMSPRALYQDASGALWIGTYGDGLVQYKDGTFTALTTQDGLYDDVVSAIVPDDHGSLWMSGNRGIFRARLDDLHATAKGTRDAVPTVGYGTEAGLLIPETSGGFQPATWTDTRGRIWFPTLEGAAVVNPDEAHQTLIPPRTDVHGVRHQNESVPLQGSKNELPMGRRSFEVAYTGINLSRPDAVRFQYRLNGFDNDWQTAGKRRTAFYTNIPPGAYPFQVRAANEDGQWGRPATLHLRVPPRFYETTWFTLLIAGVLVGGLGAAYVARIYTLRRRERELQQRVNKQTAALRIEKQRAARALKTVAEQKEALAALDAAKSEFFANVSHEFRTPLTVALGLLEEWVEAPNRTLPEPAERDLRRVLLNNRRLLRLVNQLLDIARLESDTMELHVQPVALDTFLEPIALAFAPLAERQNITFERNIAYAGPKVVADPDQLETIIVNLLSNAFKFTPSGGCVALVLRSHTDTITIAVQDTGPGIPEAEQEAIFDRFHQTQTGHTQIGTGIGLALARALAQQHGGDITVESKVGEGSRFTLRLPHDEAHFRNRPDVQWQDPDERSAAPSPPNDTSIISACHETPLTQQETGAPDDDGPTVLVVDDNVDIRAYLRRTLSDTYYVMEAADGIAGLDQARAHTPDCIVSDVMMPRMDGLDLLRALRDDPATDFIPVVLLTARATIADKLDGLERGADDYLTKPFRPEEVRTRIRNLIAQRMRLRERFRTHPPDASSKALTSAGATSDSPPFLRTVEEAVRTHLSDESLTVSMLAQTVGVSRSKLYRKLKDLTEESPADIIWRVRLEEGHALLRAGEGNVSEVAYGVGFKSVSHFSNRFREHFGDLPSVVGDVATQRSNRSYCDGFEG